MDGFHQQILPLMMLLSQTLTHYRKNYIFWKQQIETLESK